MDVSIIIVNYNTKDLTRDCLSSVFEKTSGVDFDVYVVDNASSDGSQEMVRTEFPQVKLIANGTNIGFGCANNIALRRTSSKYVFLLNSDTVLLNNAVKIFHDYCETHVRDRLGGTGGFLLNTEGRVIHSYRKFDTISGTILLLAESFIKDRIFGVERWNRLIGKKARGQDLMPGELTVDYVTGADLFIAKSVLDDVGLFDENFFMYSEEADLQKRMRLKGYSQRVIRGPEIIHLEGKSSRQSLSKRAMIYGGKFRYMRKYHSRCLLWIGKICFLLMELPVIFLAKESFSDKVKYIRSWSKF